ncbi:hypothetical protein E4T49_00115 [Aureobasidium sp. EXF-10728]|nr:hypothetical protein E4T49_00115 [Aureobasidium sp. EXF-10728]
MTDNAKQINDTIPLKGSQRTQFEFPDTFDHSNIPLENDEIPVVIIGSSMVGMFMGLLLGFHGHCSVRSVSFDRHPSTAIHPRAALFLLRTVEILRQLGLEELFIKESQSNFDLDAGMLVVEKLYKGKTLASFQESDPKEVARVTPSVRLWLTQNMCEPLLRQRALDYGAEQRFNQTVVHYEETPDGVLVFVKDEAGSLKKYKTQYLVSSDGNRSATRKKEGIEWHGPGQVSNAISINFRADLVPYLGTRAVHGTTYIGNKDVSGGFRLDVGGKGGFLIVTRAAGRADFEPDSVSDQEARKFFEQCSGISADECDLKIQSVSYWSVAAYNAETFRGKKEHSRVFIMGDAAHVMPPTGGMGGNTGVADAYNLAWKLGFVINGKASPNLLKTYDQERQPAAEFSMQQAFARLVTRVMHGKTPEGMESKPEVSDIICEIGYRYTTGAFVRQENADSDKGYEDPYKPYVLPGGRLPHVALESSGKTLSSLDLIKQNFVLFTVQKDSPWLEAAQKQCISVDCHVIGSTEMYRDRDGIAQATWKLAEGEALLVRPDGIIAWRSGGRPGACADALKTALDTILQ